MTNNKDLSKNPNKKKKNNRNNLNNSKEVCKNRHLKTSALQTNQQLFQKQVDLKQKSNNQIEVKMPKNHH